MAQQIGTAFSEMRAYPAQALHLWKNVRDFNMARQLRWIVDRQPSDAGTLFGLHNYHLQNCHSHEADGTLSTMAQYLTGALPAPEIVLIADHNNFSLKPGDAATHDGNQGGVACLGLPSFVLDLRAVYRSPEAQA